MTYKVGVIIEKDNNGYYAYCPDLEGCQSMYKSEIFFMRILIIIFLTVISLFIQSCDNGVSSSKKEKTWIVGAYHDFSTHNSKLVLLDEYGSDERIIYTTSQAGENITEVDWFPEANKIVFSKTLRDSSYIVLYDVRNHKFDTIYSTKNYFIPELSVASDQSCIAMIQFDMALTQSSLCIIDVDGTDLKRLTDHKSSQPTISNDSRTIYFIYENNICSIDKSGGILTSITLEKENGIFNFDMTPDASKLIYYRMKVGDNEEYNQLFLTDNIGSFHQSLFDLDTIDVGVLGIDYISSPKISPGGDKVCFGHISEVLTIFDIGTSRMTNFRNDDRNYTDICWLPDGEGIIYATNDDNKMNIKRMNIEGDVEVIAVYNSGDWKIELSPVRIKY